MSDTHHLALQARLEELDAYTHAALRQFPRYERYGLCLEIRNTVTRILRYIVVAWKRRQKSAALFDLDVEIEVLRAMIRKSHALGHIDVHRLETWMRHVNQIGAMVGAWIKSAREAEQSRK